MARKIGQRFSSRRFIKGTNDSPGQTKPIYDFVSNRNPAGFITAESEKETQALLKELNQAHLAARPGDSRLDARIASYELAAKLQMSAPEVLISPANQRRRKNSMVWMRSSPRISANAV